MMEIQTEYFLTKTAVHETNFEKHGLPCKMHNCIDLVVSGAISISTYLSILFFEYTVSFFFVVARKAEYAALAILPMNAGVFL